MIRRFGPWATTVNAGSQAHLSTFWKRRLAMLPATYRSSARLGGRAVLLLFIAAALVWALPTLLSDVEQGNAQAADAATEGTKAEKVVADVRAPGGAASPTRGPSRAVRMSPREAISVIESLEKKFQVFKWRAHAQQTRLKNSDDTRTFEVIPPCDVRSETTYDAVGKRFLTRMKCVRARQQGAAPFASSVIEQSFDGDAYRYLQIRMAGVKVPTLEDAPGMGLVTKQHDDSAGTVVESSGFENGLAYMPPHFWVPGTDYPLRPLSTLLRRWLDEGKVITVAEDAAGVWTIDVNALEAGNRVYRITYDTKKGGVATGLRALAFVKDGAPPVEMVRVEIDLQQVAGGVWVPKTIKQVFPSKEMYLVSCEAVEVNPTVTADTFRLEFPKGAHVDDRVDKVYYKVGDAVDRQKAVRDFRTRHNIQDTAPAPTTTP